MASFVILCRASIPLTLAVFACVPLMGVVSVYLNGRLRARFRQQRVQIGELNSTIEDSLLGQGVVKAFAAEDEEREKFARGNRAFEQIKTLDVYKRQHKAGGHQHGVAAVRRGAPYQQLRRAGEPGRVERLHKAAHAAALAAQDVYKRQGFAPDHQRH